MTTPMSLDDAAKALSTAMQETLKKHSTWYIIQGALMLTAGVVAVIFPLISSLTLAVFLGWLLILAGVVQAISLIGATKVPQFWLQLVSIVLAMVIGYLFIRDPEIGVETLTLLLIVFFMVEGMAKVVFALTIRPFPKWSWVLASGILGLVLAVILLANPVAAIWLLGIFIGINLITQGASLIYLALGARKT